MSGRLLGIAGLLFASALLWSCSGSSSSGRGRSSFRIVYPPAAAWVSESTLTVRVESGGPATLRQLEVNGIPANWSPGSRTWTATIPVVPGPQLVEVVRVAANGSQQQRTISIQGGAVLLPGPLCLDAAAQELLVVDKSQATLVAVDLDQGSHRVVSTDRIGGLWPFFNHGMDVDTTRGEVLFTWGDEMQVSDVLGVNLATGAQFSCTDRYGGWTLWDVQSIAVDTVRDQLLVVGDPYWGGLFTMDLVSGSSTPITHPSLNMGWAVDVAVDGPGGRAWFTYDEAGQEGLFEVDLINETVAERSGPSLGAGPAFDQPKNLAVDVPRGRAYVQDDRRILEVDLVSGDRRVVVEHANAARGDLAWDPRGRLLEAHYGRVVTIDPASGSVSDFLTGHSALSNIPGDVLARDGRLLSANRGELSAFDPGTGMTSVLSDSQVGSGPLWRSGREIAVHPNGRHVYVIDLKEVYQVDLPSGDRRLVSGNGVGSGPEPSWYSAMVFFPAPGQALMLGSHGDLFRLEVATGRRTLISAGPGGGSPDFCDLEWLSAPGRVLVLRREQLLEVNLSNGARTTLMDWGGLPWGLDLAVLPDRQSVLLLRHQGVDFLYRTVGSVLTRVSLNDFTETVVTDNSMQALPPFEGATGLGLMPDGRTVYSRDAVLDALVAIDVESGARVIIDS